MSNKIIQKYITAFQKLRVDRAHGVAPHKPVLLLSIIEQIESGNITTNKAEITPQLVTTFAENWAILVTSSHQKSFALPFYHLTSDKFWTLIPNPGYEVVIQLKAQMRCFSALQQAVAFAQFEADLFALLQNPLGRSALRDTLLNEFFPETKSLYLNKKGFDKLKAIEDQILHESPMQYQLEFKGLDGDNLAEEVFVRGEIFKMVIPRIYGYSCAISGLRIIALMNLSMVDACHIKPFSVSHDDTIFNGFALCPTIHRAFDRGLLAIDDHYRVMVSSQFSENNSHYGLKQLAGKPMLLPDDPRFYPARENFAWHRANRFKP